MARVLYVGYPAEGHVNPTLGLTKELSDRGEDVTYYCTDDYKQRVEDSGAHYRSLGVFFNQKQREANNLTFNAYEKFAHRLGWMDQAIEKVMLEVQREQYDYVIYDAQAIHGCIIAHLLKLPSITTWTTFAYNRESSNWFSSERGHPSERIPRTFWDTVIGFGRKYSYPMRAFEDLYVFRSDLNIVFTSRLFQIDSHLFDDSFKFVGPSIYHRKDQDGFPFEQLAGDTVIYVSMGTIFTTHSELYRMCFDAFEDMDMKVVLSVGKNTNIDDMNGIPPNFIVRGYVPQLDVLRLSSVFITHCGMNSTNEGLYFGVPLVMIPCRLDQPLVARRVEELGAGITIDKEALSAERLRNDVRAVLQDPVYRERGREIGKSLRQAGGQAKAVDEIFNFKQRARTGRYIAG